MGQLESALMPEHYLYWKEFTIQIDHKPLTGYSARVIQTRGLQDGIWSLQQYQFEIEHGVGSLNGNVDGLSRGPI